MRFDITVHPNSGRQEIIKLSEKDYKVYLKKPSENNKANIELIKLLNNHFNKKTKITRGKNSRKKEVEII